jgi:drug/metabolite transporter (DMT)-like permease
MAFLLAAWAALFYGFADFCGGYAARRSPLLSVLVLSQAVGTLVALASAAAMPWGAPSTRDLLWGSLAGATGALGLFVLYGGLARSIVAIVSPASAVVAALLPVVSGLLLGERPPAPAVAGAVLCFPAILLLTWEGDRSARRGKAARTALGYGVLAGLGFGCFFIALSRTHAQAGAWPLVAARAASLTVCGAALLASRQPFRLARPDLFPALAAGAGDMVANVFFLLAAHGGMLSLVAVIASLYPAPTVILAWIFQHQRIPPIRLAGLALALTGVALISLR